MFCLRLFSLMLIVFNLLFRTWGSPGLFVLLQLSILGISSVPSESSQFLIDITALVEVHSWLIGLQVTLLPKVLGILTKRLKRVILLRYFTQLNIVYAR